MRKVRKLGNGAARFAEPFEPPSNQRNCQAGGPLRRTRVLGPDRDSRLLSRTRLRRLEHERRAIWTAGRADDRRRMESRSGGQSTSVSRTTSGRPAMNSPIFRPIDLKYSVWRCASTAASST
jgi:hypothetical protein